MNLDRIEFVGLAFVVAGVSLLVAAMFGTVAACGAGCLVAGAGLIAGAAMRQDTQVVARKRRETRGRHIA